MRVPQKEHTKKTLTVNVMILSNSIAGGMLKSNTKYCEYAPHIIIIIQNRAFHTVWHGIAYLHNDNDMKMKY